MFFKIIFSIIISVIGTLLIVSAMREFAKDHYDPNKVLIRVYPGAIMLGTGIGLSILFIGTSFI